VRNVTIFFCFCACHLVDRFKQHVRMASIGLEHMNLVVSKLITGSIGIHVLLR
jgi:hypothetical protein